MTIDEVLEWLRSLKTEINVENLTEYEKERLVKIVNEMLRIQNNCDSFLSVAAQFAVSMRPTSVAELCSYLKFFEEQHTLKRKELSEKQPTKSKKEIGN